jgi:hypothetical protein
MECCGCFQFGVTFGDSSPILQVCGDNNDVNLDNSYNVTYNGDVTNYSTDSETITQMAEYVATQQEQHLALQEQHLALQEQHLALQDKYLDSLEEVETNYAMWQHIRAFALVAILAFVLAVLALAAVIVKYEEKSATPFPETTKPPTTS